MGDSNVMGDVVALMRAWEEEHTQSDYDPTPTLTRLAEIIEIEAENYQKMDPDPFDERHPSRTDPECKLGQILKALFRKDNFMTKLVNDYLRDTYYTRLGLTGYSIDQLNIAATRLMLDIMPGLETSVVFQPEMDGLILRLIKWTTDSVEPLQSYATGLLAAAMEIPDIATRFRDQNAQLIPLLLKRLRRLQNNSSFITHSASIRPFARFSAQSPNTPDNMKSPPYSSSTRENGKVANASRDIFASPERVDIFSKKHELGSEEQGQPQKKKLKLDSTISPTLNSSPTKSHLFNETSNSSWAELESFVIGSIQMFPPTIVTRQILILKYLTPMGEYQEFLSHVFENNALELILKYANVRETKETRLGFEALKYLAALLCHKKFSIEFIQCNGLEVLLEVPRPSVAATGVSICLYYLAYCEEAIERVCLLPHYIVSALVNYGLWLLECSHDSGRCHATMFFGLTFPFKVILDEFDAQDGLRKLHNVISTLQILSNEDLPPLNEDAECAARQIVRHVCVAIKKYTEAHLFYKVDKLRRSQLRPNERNLPQVRPQPSYIACKSSPEEVQQQIETLLQNLPFRAHWSPIDNLLKLGCVTLLLKIIAFAYEWNYSGRAETVRSALDVLAIACVMPRVQMLFCEKVDLPEEAITVGMNIILGAAEGEIVADADVQKAALRVIVNCVCAPINRVGGSMTRYSSQGTSSPSKKTKIKSSEELIQKVWETVRANSGIMVLLQLMNVKTPITDADCIRTLACKALAGLARSETVRQILSKLPLFTNGQLQNLMRDPILQEKRQEHVTFQKHAYELLERLSGKTKHTATELDVSLANIHRANVVAQTKIQFNDSQLLQLIHQHLIFKGLKDTANLLVKEANLSSSLLTTNTNHPNKFRYMSPSTPSRNLDSNPKSIPTLNGMRHVIKRNHMPSFKTRLSFSSPVHRALSMGPSTSVEAATSINGTSPTIKLIKKNVTNTPTPNSRLQKQISTEHPKFANTFDLEEIKSVPPRISLDSIITEYLTNQHALCKNPMATCPQFNLFVPHKCPDPKQKIEKANNFAIRSARRQMGYQHKNMDKKLIHSRFCPVQTIREPGDDTFFTCAKFMPGDQEIIVGSFSGEVKLFNVYTGKEESMFQAHDSYIVQIQPRMDSSVILTTATWGRPLSALWSVNSYNLKYALHDEEWVEFSKVAQDRILGTKGEVATIYDVNTGTKVTSFTPPSSNQYTKNKATYSPNDDLILTDGVLFDVNSGQVIHKLDKLNQTQSGVFHPNGLEIISNTEVWDIRTFHLLKTVPVLNECQVVFAPVNDAIYAISIEQEYDSSFKTLDASDYSSIATFDVKRNIYDLSVNKYDRQIAVVENQGMYHSVQESVVRIYDVGRRKDDEEEDQEEEDDDDDDDLDGSDDDGSDDAGQVLLAVAADNNDNDGNDDNNGENDDDGNNENNDEEENDGTWNGSDNDDDNSWTDVSNSDDSDGSFTSDSSGLSLLQDLLFDY